MSKAQKLKITGKDYTDSQIWELLVGKHVKFKYEGWTKVYRVKVLRTPYSDAVVLSINEGVTQYNLKTFISEEDPCVSIKKSRLFAW